MWIPIETEEINVGRVESAIGVGSRATADDVRSVYQATSSCRTVPEIVSLTGLSAEVVAECVATLKALGIVAEEAAGRVCNVEAACSLCKQFDKITSMCK